MKKSLILSILWSSIMGLSLFGSGLALASTIPSCPQKLATHRLTQVQKDYVGGWVAMNNIGNWTVNVDINNKFIVYRKDAIERGYQIELTQGHVVESKQLDKDGSYFWECDYAIAPKYMSVGDLLGAFSPIYKKGGTLSATQLTNAQKIALLKNQE